MQTVDEPGSVPIVLRLMGACHLSTTTITGSLYRSTLQRRLLTIWTGRPQSVGIRELSSSDVHSTTVASRLVGSYPTFSPLPLMAQSPAWSRSALFPRRLFSSTLISPRGLLDVTQRNALCCPDFPHISQWWI